MRTPNLGQPAGTDCCFPLPGSTTLAAVPAHGICASIAVRATKGGGGPTRTGRWGGALLFTTSMHSAHTSSADCVGLPAHPTIISQPRSGELGCRGKMPAAGSAARKSRAGREGEPSVQLFPCIWMCAAVRLSPAPKIGQRENCVRMRESREPFDNFWRNLHGD